MVCVVSCFFSFPFVVGITLLVWCSKNDGWCLVVPQHFFSFFKTLIGKQIIIELKNDLALRGTLHSVDQYLNIKLTNMTVVDPKKYPHLVRGELLAYVLQNPFPVSPAVRCPVPGARAPC
jgi:U6 snRNA-associated Sm-like protein LSm2